jgi:hypothetical protein
VTKRTGTARREFYSKRLAQKQEELAAIDAQLLGTLSKIDELKLNRDAEKLLEKIEGLEANLNKLDAQNKNSNLRHLNLEKSFQKIDNEAGKEIAQSVNRILDDKNGAILLFLQRCTKQKGCYCLNEVLDLMISDRKVGDEIIGDFRPYPVDLGSPISEFNEAEFSKRLASHLSPNLEGNLHDIIKKLCASLRGGSIVFIKVENWDSVIEQEQFLDWFIKNFWQVVICELKPVFEEYSKIRFIVALMAKSKVFLDCCFLEYFCVKDTFDFRKIIEIPLPDWTVEDIKTWLINVQGLSNQESLELASQIYRESEGTPHTICSILEEKFNVC